MYINGQFWGLYDPIERPTENFAASYLGGSADQLRRDQIRRLRKRLEPRSDQRQFDAWTQLYNLIGTINGSTTAAQANAIYQEVQGNNPDGTPNARVSRSAGHRQPDPVSDADLLHGQSGRPEQQLPGQRESQQLLCHPARGRSTGFQFVATDSEWTLIDPTTNRVNSEASTPSVNRRPRRNGSFSNWKRVPNSCKQVGDAIETDFFNNGPLTVQATDRPLRRAGRHELRTRGGRSRPGGEIIKLPGYTYTRNVDWQARINYDENAVSAGAPPASCWANWRVLACFPA